MPELWIGSNNKKKRAELSRLLAPLDIVLRTPDELGQDFAPIEDQPDFAGNARKKATLLANLSGGIALADDSGLCVDALDVDRDEGQSPDKRSPPPSTTTRPQQQSRTRVIARPWGVCGGPLLLLA